MKADLSLLFLILIAGAFIGVSFEKFRASLRREKWRRNNPGKWQKQQKPNAGAWTPKLVEAEPKKVDSADQLRTVMAAQFTVQPLLNKSETRLFKELDRIVIARHPEWQVMAQVSLGEILRTKDKAAYGCINSKRVDLLVVDGDCNARHAIEYQGGGHYLTDAAARDAVKKEALRKAGIGYHEVVAGHTTMRDLRALVEKLVPTSL